jgi:SAM-dependent methyltransferase
MTPHSHSSDTSDPATWWDSRYGVRTQIWSGNPNAVLVDVAGALDPGRALDLGSGEGADAVWLAERGWDVTGVDISRVAVERAGRHADERGVPRSRIRFVAIDLGGEPLPGSFDLVAASYLQSPVELDRLRVLSRAAALVAPGGHLLLVSHGPGSDHRAVLDASPHEWVIAIEETRERNAITPEGDTVRMDDEVLLARRTDGV